MRPSLFPEAQARWDSQVEETRAYTERGYCVVRQLFGANEMDILQAEVDRLSRLDGSEYDRIRAPLIPTIDGRLILEKLDPVIDLSPLIEDIALSPAMTRLASRLLASDTVTLFRDKLIFKAPGAVGYPVHQDYSWWHRYPPHSMCTLAVAITGCRVDNGAIVFHPGSHHAQIVPNGERRPLSLSEEKALPETIEIAEADPGDVIAFHSLTAHWSGPNLTDKPRPLIYLGYLKGEFPVAYEQHRRVQDTKLHSLGECSFSDCRRVL